jgi:alcohol dehydrogenase/propanol-preferring alcohol dehydrogenase
MQISPIQLLIGSQSMKGWYSGTSIDSEMRCVRTGVRSMNEVFPLESGGSSPAHDERGGAIPCGVDDGSY